MKRKIVYKAENVDVDVDDEGELVIYDHESGEILNGYYHCQEDEICERFNLEKWWKDFCKKYGYNGREICMGYRREYNNEPTIAVTFNNQTLENANAKISNFNGILLRMDGSIEYKESK